MKAEYPSRDKISGLQIGERAFSPSRLARAKRGCRYQTASHCEGRIATIESLDSGSQVRLLSAMFNALYFGYAAVFCKQGRYSFWGLLR